MSRAVGVGSYSVSPEKVRMCVQIYFGSAGQVIYLWWRESIKHNEQNGTRVDGRHELLYGTASEQPLNRL